MDEGEFVWASMLMHGHKMPITEPYKLDLYSGNIGNQISPALPNIQSSLATESNLQSDSFNNGCAIYMPIQIKVYCQYENIYNIINTPELIPNA